MCVPYVCGRVDTFFSFQAPIAKTKSWQSNNPRPCLCCRINNKKKRFAPCFTYHISKQEKKNAGQRVIIILWKTEYSCIFAITRLSTTTRKNWTPTTGWKHHYMVQPQAGQGRRYSGSLSHTSTLVRRTLGDTIVVRLWATSAVRSASDKQTQTHCAGVQ